MENVRFTDHTYIRQGGHHGTTVLSCHIFLVFSVVPKVNLRGKWLRFIYRPYTILSRNQVTDENLMEGKYKLEMWANAQRDGRPSEYRWRPLFNASKFG